MFTNPVIKIVIPWTVEVYFSRFIALRFTGAPTCTGSRKLGMDNGRCFGRDLSDRIVLLSVLLMESTVRPYDATTMSSSTVRLYQSTTVVKLIVRADRRPAMSIKRRILVGRLWAKVQRSTRPRPDIRRYALKAGTVWKPYLAYVSWDLETGLMYLVCFRSWSWSCSNSDLRKAILCLYCFVGWDVCSILGAFGVQEQDWNRSRKCNSRSHNIRKRYLVVSRRTTGLRVYGIVELFNITIHHHPPAKIHLTLTTSNNKEHSALFLSFVLCPTTVHHCRIVW